MDKKELLDELTVFDIYGNELKKNSKGFSMRCPFHKDNAPSMQVYEAEKSFHCFGCQVGGSAFDFIMKRYGIEFIEALQYLANKAGVQLKARRSPYSRLFEINKAASKIYTEALESDEEALHYLMYERGLAKETIEHFCLGSTNATSVVTKLKAQGFSENEIITAGLGVKDKSGKVRDYFFKRIMFPIVQQGRVVGFGGRLIEENAKNPKYLNSPATPIFKKKSILYGLDPSAIKEKKYAKVVEGYIDVIQCHQHGHRNTVSPLGTAFSEEHVEQIQHYTDWVVVIFDGDSAGSFAAERTVKLLFDQKIRGTVVTLPEGADPDSFLRGNGSLEELIGKSESFACFLAKKFPATRKMLLNALLLRPSLESAEFISCMGTKEEGMTFMELNARSMLEQILSTSQLLIRKKEIEVRKFNNFFVLLSKKKFVFWRKANSSDINNQAVEMLNQFQKLKSKRIR